MPLVNQSKREINVKIVYAGLPHAGKSTNLATIYQRLKPEFRGQSRAIPMGSCVMQLCEFQPPGGGPIPGFTMKYHLYTLSGEGADDTQWRMTFKGADGIVFIADARSENRDANREAFSRLLVQLHSSGVDMSQVPIVVQCNQQDVPGALDPSSMENILAVPGLTIVPAVASRGDGVLETLTTAVRKISALMQKSGLPAVESYETYVDNDTETHPVEQPDTDTHLSANGSHVADGSADDLGQPPPISSPVKASLDPDEQPLEIPLRLTVAGVDKQFILTLSLREAGAKPCEPLRGAAYVR